MYSNAFIYLQTPDEDSEAEKMSPLLDSEKSIEKKVEHLQPVVESIVDLFLNIIQCVFTYFFFQKKKSMSF